MKNNRTWKRIVLGTLLAIVVLVVLVIAFISPIAKYVIEKYDMQILGRKIRLSWIYVNPFTGYAHLHNLKVYEHNSDSLFVNAKDATISYATWKMLFKTYEISSVSLSGAEIHLVEDKAKINLEDIIEKFSPKDTVKSADTTKTHFNILNMKIEDSRFYYVEKNIPINYFITNLNITGPGLRWNSDTLQFNVSFKNGPGSGNVTAYFGMNIKNLNYTIKAAIKKFDMQIINQYFQDVSEFGELRGFLETDMAARGNFSSAVALTAKGYLGINDFHFGKNEKEDYASFSKLAVNMINISPANFDYIFDTISLYQPYFKYERYDSLDNLTRMFGKGGKDYTDAKESHGQGQFNLIVALADFFEQLGKNFIKSHYSAHKFSLTEGNFTYNDFSLRQEFSASVYPLDIMAKDIDRNYNKITVQLNSPLKPHGVVGVDFSVNPHDFGNFTIDYGITDIAIPDFNPYVTTYTSFPLVNGSLSLKGNWDVRDSVINSMNHLVILSPERGKRIKAKDAKWLPLPLILAIVKDPGNYIDYEIPIMGNLNNPKFKLKSVILDIVKNIFVKPPTSPYRAYIKKQQNSIDKFQMFRWDPLQTVLTPGQNNFVTDLAGFLKKNTADSITLTPTVFRDREKEAILLYLAKKKFYMRAHKLSPANFTESDSIEVYKMSIKDKDFVKALSAGADTMLFTVQEKCARWIDSATVEAFYIKLLAARVNDFKTVFEQQGVNKQTIFKPAQNNLPRSGFSNFYITYSSDIPDKLRKALNKLELNPGEFIQASK